MEKKTARIMLPCDCGCCMFVIEKTVWEDGDMNYNISVQDSSYGHSYNTLWGRLQRAVKALFGKPIYFNDVYLEGEDTFQQLVRDMNALAASNLTDYKESYL